MYNVVPDGPCWYILYTLCLTLYVIGRQQSTRHLSAKLDLRSYLWQPHFIHDVVHYLLLIFVQTLIFLLYLGDPYLERTYSASDKLCLLKHNKLCSRQAVLHKHNKLCSRRLSLLKHNKLCSRQAVLHKHNKLCSRQAALLKHNKLCSRRLSLFKHNTLCSRRLSLLKHNKLCSRQAIPAQT